MDVPSGKKLAKANNFQIPKRLRKILLQQPSSWRFISPFWPSSSLSYLCHFIILLSDRTRQWNGWFWNAAPTHWALLGNKHISSKKICTKSDIVHKIHTYIRQAWQISTDHAKHRNNICQNYLGGFCSQCWRNAWCCCLRPFSPSCK